ncbi:hypothetical protein FOXG_18953 [Fusarium oxysporum f. sp. lycopersici 4287]|uniref:Uncharacterized protein n=2 Tax=Fusarium oxysporum TaxID=5507 RepID=A0A0J9USB4_FUSO4|nr:hypothetical protein FOXG_18953 [Fusarium oxysporum f. sp. lycopersici 4287]EXK38760.1 hypothetical protein FOMG_06298 [Fusarium oxysporum f. sp. melonis 26406]KNB01828.1 hypothetical protein FOXG_18953 [Fusarium oxysporum f. sp. lycopersici 4287]
MKKPTYVGTSFISRLAPVDQWKGKDEYSATSLY